MITADKARKLQKEGHRLLVLEKRIMKAIRNRKNFVNPLFMCDQNLTEEEWEEISKLGFHIRISDGVKYEISW
ncbi:hypothetical protein LCGC14_0930440 [marine sediment metagenome]|uniref:Uncharacterized protein n=1 Tax=marine sediment metagenome TaxID=412755 RepID=A0A0F9RUM4_9ZZZZ